MGRKIKVIHVDDEELLLDQTKLYLEKEKEQLEIDSTNSPKKALEKVKNNSYDVIISDYKMPEMDGLELLEKIKHDTNERDDLPFIIFTGKGREEVAMEALNLGADRYLQKGGDPPSQYKMLAETVVQLVNAKKYEKRFEDFFDNLPYMAFMISPSGIVQELNKAFIDTTGYERSDIVGEPMSELEHIIPEESLEKAILKFSSFLEEGGVDPFTVKYKHKSGEKRYLEINAVNMFERADLDRVIGVGRDITEEKEAEDREEYLHSILRHDVRNKARTVHGYHELLESFDLPEEAENCLSKAKKVVEDSLDLIDKVKTVRKVGGEEEIEETVVGTIIQEVIKKNEPRASEKGIEVEYDDVDCKVQGGPLLEELFLNLVENSIVHSEGEKIRVFSRETENKCIVTVEDDGHGVPDEDEGEIFERGFKSGKTGGSGIGLYLVKEIVESYDGSVEVKDSDLGGARFDVHLKKSRSENV